MNLTQKMSDPSFIYFSPDFQLYVFPFLFPILLIFIYVNLEFSLTPNSTIQLFTWRIITLLFNQFFYLNPMFIEWFLQSTNFGFTYLHFIIMSSNSAIYSPIKWFFLLLFWIICFFFSWYLTILLQALLQSPFTFFNCEQLPILHPKYRIHPPRPIHPLFMMYYQFKFDHLFLNFHSFNFARH